jgi:hypothetical protein
MEWAFPQSEPSWLPVPWPRATFPRSCRGPGTHLAQGRLRVPSGPIHDVRGLWVRGWQGASRVSWLTREDNATAIAIYEKLALRTGFIQYRIGLQAG